MSTGIIAEYNPFHNGHLHQIQAIRQLLGENEIIAACISGGFTQRGEPAILDKWKRAACAVASGKVNLVIELPAIFAASSAETFAAGGVQLLNALGLENIAFGTCYPDLNQLQAIAHWQNNADAKALQPLLKQGISYGAALGQYTAEKLQTDPAILAEPNTILAVEYLKAMEKKNSPLKPLPVMRQGANHHDREIAGNTASGTHIRQLATELKHHLQELMQVVPMNTLAAIQEEKNLPSAQALLPLIQYQLLKTSASQLSEIYGINEGLEYKLLHSLKADTYTKLAEGISSKRYPLTRIQRILFYMLAGLTREKAKELIAKGPQYIRVLAFDDKGRQLLSQLKKSSLLPVITKASDYLTRRDIDNQESLTPLQQSLLLDILSTNLQAMAAQKPAALFSDMTTSPVYLQTIDKL